MTNSHQIREIFLKYFESLDHIVFKSDSLIPSADPSLLFTTAGMVQFKDYFLGKKTDIKRACSIQKCLRTSDIEKVGHTFRHLTFFEMLGNFSFGDYFKKEAIEWAWKFITDVIQLDRSRIYITVYKHDEEAYEIWSKIVSKDRIYKLSEETNFWKMGNTGPCGPCSEIIYDLGENFGCKRPSCGPDCECNRFLEVWNLVFTQFDLQLDGKLIPLKQKNIDTGMGLERLCMVVNNLNSVFETDLFFPIRQELLKYILPSTSDSTNYINAISDHIRAATFAISEGILPSNEARGYVIRKIIRRALRYVKLLNYNQPILYKIVPKVVEEMKTSYPELELHREKVALIIKSEEEKFLETLDSGLNLIEEVVKESKGKISGEIIFKLYDTYGFPKELIDEILKEKNISYDEEEFLEAQKKAKEIAKASWKGIKAISKDIYTSFPSTIFLGYSQLSATARILGIIKENQKLNKALKTDLVEIIFDKTPFYGESGGQIGDSGVIESVEDKKVIGEIKDTKKVENRIIHITKLYENIEINNEVVLKVDIERRKNIMRHHTATHLLHKALKEVLGSHVAQAGSLVADDYFRFDFIHWKALTEDEILQVEKIVNQKILECLPVSIIETDLEIAKKLGAVALFEEKYEKKVRMVVIGGRIENEEIIEQPFSIELCGGTHCYNTGEIGIFKILSESSVGTNLRRIEAICGKKVYQYINYITQKLTEISELLSTKNYEEILPKIEKIIQQNKQLQKEIENLKLGLVSQKAQELLEEKNGIKFYIKYIPETDIKFLRTLSDELTKKYKNESYLILLYSTKDEKISVVLRITEKLLKEGITTKKFTEKINFNLGIKLGGRDDFA
ncbi:MAG: alanine--tRNA ligase, partial [Elusimicrobiota bacterium]|nr:alanine--tRNA ligase [Endomicrobiia bacterium]MDW8165333.1 alanine--tRNA ligase [Elusimicrobiota bacterium]